MRIHACIPFTFEYKCVIEHEFTSIDVKMIIIGSSPSLNSLRVDHSSIYLTPYIIFLLKIRRFFIIIFLT